MTKIQFSKYSGCGNDFIMIDHRSLPVSLFQKDLVRNLCDRQNGIGADGVIFLENSALCDTKMRIFNADGSEPEMCGNGIRCFGKFAEEMGISLTSLTIETMHRKLKVEKDLSHIKVDMGSTINLRKNISISIDDEHFTMDYIDTGVPHVVIFVDDLEKAPLLTVGKTIRYHSAFSPQGTNVNFVKIVDASTLQMRTYERGVEGETLACGTGATAAAIVASLKHGLSAPIQVIPKSGDQLLIDFKIDSYENITAITQSGPAIKRYNGSFDLKDF